MTFKKPKPLTRKPRNENGDKMMNTAIIRNYSTASVFLPRETPIVPLVALKGPLGTIRSMSQDMLGRERSLLSQLGGEEVVRVMAAALRDDNSPQELAKAVLCFVAWYSVELIYLQTGNRPPVLLDPYPLAIVIRQLADDGIDAYDFLARKMLPVAWVQMQSQLKRVESSLRKAGIIPWSLFSDNYWTTRYAIIREFGEHTCLNIERQALLSAIRTFAFTTINQLALDFQPLRGLEYFIGQRPPDWMLAAEVDISLRRGDIHRAKQLIMDVLVFNQSNWKPGHLFRYGEILSEPNWKVSDRPLHYVPRAVSIAVKKLKSEPFRDEWKARRAGVTLVTNETESDENPTELVAAPTAYFDDEVMARTDLRLISKSVGLPSDQEAILREKYGKRPSDRPGDTSGLKNWDTRRITSGNQLLKAGEKWGDALRGSEAVRFLPKRS